MKLDEVKEKFERTLREKANPRSIALLLGALTLLSFLTFIVVTKHSSEEYAVLYTHLSPDDAGEILSVLQQEHIPYKVVGDGSIILVPKDKVYDVRLKLAAKGIPHGKVVGFEIFDETKLGITQFQQNVEYLRALEGELERTIRRLDAVRDVKVNIALPKDSIFVRPSEEPKASVLIDLWPGRDLTPEQVKAIVFLVSHAVPGLKPENVTVVDNRGRVLTDLISQGEDETGATKELQIKQKLEREIERKVESMLSRVLGGSKVVVRASVEVETGKVQTRREIYDPDMTAVVSQRKVQERETGVKKQPQGAPGTTTNVPPVVNIGSQQQVVKREKKDVTTNYDVSKTVEESLTPVFRIKRITVGVLVDGKYEKVKTKDGTVEYKFVPRSPQEIKTYEEIVKSAIGYDPKRGDVVTVASVPFETKLLADQKGREEKQTWIYYVVGGVAASVLLLGALLFKFLRGKGKGREELPSETQLPEALMAEVEARKKHEEELEEMKLEQDPLYLKLVEVGKEYPELLTNVISKWLKEEGLR